MRIPVYAGPRIVAYCDAVSIRRFLDAPNAEVVRKRKTNMVVQINLVSYGDDSKLRSIGDSPSPTYEEHLELHTLTVLKRFDDQIGHLVRWSDADAFNPHRFNPDHVQLAPQRGEPQCCPMISIAAKPAEAPRMPPARFCIKRDPLMPWSAGNSREVF